MVTAEESRQQLESAKAQLAQQEQQIQAARIPEPTKQQLLSRTLMGREQIRERERLLNLEKARATKEAMRIREEVISPYETKVLGAEQQQEAYEKAMYEYSAQQRTLAKQRGLQRAYGLGGVPGYEPGGFDPKSLQAEFAAAGIPYTESNIRRYGKGFVLPAPPPMMTPIEELYGVTPEQFYAGERAPVRFPEMPTVRELGELSQVRYEPPPPLTFRERIGAGISKGISRIPTYFERVSKGAAEILRPTLEREYKPKVIGPIRYPTGITYTQLAAAPGKGVELAAEISGRGWGEIYERTIEELPERFRPRYGFGEEKGELITGVGIERGVGTAIKVGAIAVPYFGEAYLASEAVGGLEKYYDPQVAQYLTPENYEVSIRQLREEGIQEGMREPTFEEWKAEAGPQYEEQLKSAGLTQFGLGAGFLGALGAIRGVRYAREPFTRIPKAEPTFRGVTEITKEGKVISAGITGYPELPIYQTRRLDRWIGRDPRIIGYVPEKIYYGATLPYEVSAKGLIKEPAFYYRRRVGARLFELGRIGGRVRELPVKSPFDKSIEMALEAGATQKIFRVSPRSEKAIFYPDPYVPVQRVKGLTILRKEPLKLPGYDVFETMTFGRRLTPRGRPTGDIMRIPGIISKEKPVAGTEIFIGKGLSQKTKPLTKAQLKTISEVQVGLIKKVPRPRVPKVREEPLIPKEAPRMVGGLGLTTIPFEGVSAYERTGVGLFPGEKLGVDLISGVGVVSKEVFDLKPVVRPSIRPALRPSIKPAIITAIKPIEALRIRPSVKLRPALRQILRVTPIVSPTFRPTPRPPRPPKPRPRPIRIPPPPVLGFPEITRRRREIRRRRLPLAFEVFIRRRGRAVRVSPGPLARGEALALGRRRVKETAAAQFWIVPKRAKPISLGLKQISEKALLPEFRKPVRRGREIFAPARFVQRRAFRIITPGEKREITYLGIAKRKGGKKILW